MSTSAAFWTEVERIADYCCAGWFALIAIVVGYFGVTSSSFVPGFPLCLFALVMWAAACRTYGLARYRWKDDSADVQPGSWASFHGPWFWRLAMWLGLVEFNAHGYPEVDSRRWWHGHGGCSDGGDLGPCDCLCHRDEDQQE